MKMLCIIGLMVVLVVIFLLALPVIFTAMMDSGDFEARYTLGLIASMTVIIAIISSIIVNFYFAPEFFGYQEIVSENSVESKE